MFVDKFRAIVLALLIFGIAGLALISYQLNNISKQNNSNHRYVISSDGTVVLDTLTGDAYETGGNRFRKIEMTK